jgi:gliding motility-associated-like protein
VPNGSFEEYYNCPNAGGISELKEWYSPTLGSPDYYNVCATNSQLGVPQNGRGYQIPKTGDAYTGFYARANQNEREYLQIELIKPLESGKKYLVHFYLSLSDIDEISIWSVGMYFSNLPISSSTFTIFTPSLTPQILNEESNFLNWDNWTEVKGEYTAQGGEKFITIGNFYTEADTDTMFIPGLNQFNPNITYIYVDDVSITEIMCEPLIPNVFTPNDDGVNDVWQTELCLDEGELATIMIYNRWGQKMCETIGKNAFWNGRTPSGNEVPEGTYYYIIITTKETYTGTIQLLR